ncbi:MAG: hypothetical protein COB08_006680 [Rhodobacteraceae bacterium]|nr:hypothetical protein [Paracoccaceae bacterium]
MAQPQQTIFTRQPKWIRWSLLLWLFLGLLPILSKAIGFQILPSPEWAAQTRVPAIVSDVLMAGLMTWGVVLGSQIAVQKLGKVKKYAVILFAPFMGFFIGSFAVATGGPIIAAIITGAEIEIQYTVGKTTAHGSRRCRTPIELKGMPFFADELCGYSPEFRNTLARGDVIMVSGRGTALGLFPQTVQRGE